MKKIACFVVCMVLMAGAAFAQERPFKGVFVAPDTKKAVQPAARLLFDGTLPFNLSGDTMYRLSAGSFDAGVGIDLASYKNLVVLRGEATQSTEGKGTFVGAGLFVNIPTMLNLLGANWIASYVNPSIGIVPGYDFDNHRYATGIVLSIIQVNF